MSTSITFNGSSYLVPVYKDTGYAQGAGNLSLYLVAIASGTLQKTGGSFTLTADTDFGANYGLKSLYYKSRATNPASAGIVRLGTAEGIYWRNAANDGDISIATDSSDRIVLSNTPLYTALTASTVPYLDASKVLTSSSVTPTELAGLHSLTASRAVITDGSGILTASSVTSTELGYVSGVTSAIQTQLDLKAPLASPTFTGTIAAASDGGTSIGTSSVHFNNLYIEDVHAVNRINAGNGTLALPSLTFASDTDTGIYNVGANQLGLVCGGAKSIYAGTAEVDFFPDQTAFLQVTGDTKEILPRPDNNWALGRSTFRFTAVYAVNGTIQTSMESTKTNIQVLDETDPTIICKVPQPILFTRPGEDISCLRMGWSADSLPDTAHPFNKEKNQRDPENVYTDAILAQHSLALRRDFNRFVKDESLILSLQNRIDILESLVAKLTSTTK